MTDTTSEDFVELAKKRLIEVIVEALKSNTMDPTIAQNLARDFLALLPTRDNEDLLLKLKGLGQTYLLALQVFDEIAIRVLKQERQFKESELPKNVPHPG